jgi:hypothetical protein
VEQERVVGPIGRKETHLPTGAHRRSHDLGEDRPRSGVGHADHFRPLGDRRQITHPNDVVDGQLVSEDHRTVLVDIDHRRQIGLVEPEVVEEGAVLAKWEAVIGIVHRALAVAQKEQEAAVDSPLQLRATLAVGLFRKHHAIPFRVESDRRQPETLLPAIRHAFGHPCGRRLALEPMVEATTASPSPRSGTRA